MAVLNLHHLTGLGPGPAAFSQSGLATVPRGKSRVIVSVPRLTANSFVLATVQESGKAMIKAAIPDVTDGTVTLLLKGTRNSSTAVGWFVATHRSLAGVSSMEGKP